MYVNVCGGGEGGGAVVEGGLPGGILGSHKNTKIKLLIRLQDSSHTM